MKIREARAAAIDWVNRYASREIWFEGAYFSGSTVGRRDDEELAIGSDVDVFVVTKEDHPPPKLGKFIYNHVLLEVTYLSWGQLMHAEEVLESYHLAGSFQVVLPI
jgi:predicted nucleotidyltransferase